MMTTAKTVCPHCGKLLSSPEKLGWHLSRECPELVYITTQDTTKQDGGKPVRADKN